MQANYNGQENMQVMNNIYRWSLSHGCVAGAGEAVAGSSESMIPIPVTKRNTRSPSLCTLGLQVRGKRGLSSRAG